MPGNSATAPRSKLVVQMAATQKTLKTEKIRDKRLMRFADGESRRKRTVLLRVDVPQPKLSIGKPRQVGRKSLPLRKLDISPADQKKRRTILSKVTKQLDDAGVSSKTLSSGTIIAQVLPDQLREIADSKLIKSIIPNRKYSF